MQRSEHDHDFSNQDGLLFDICFDVLELMTTHD